MTAPEPAPIGILLRRLRTAAALSQEALAERAGLSARAVGDLERGVHHAPRLETVRLLADALRLDAQDRAALLTAARSSLPVAAGARAERPTLLAALTPFLGREREVAAVVALMRDPTTRLVTLTGPGGIGKTRLALQAGEELAADFPHGVVVVDLAPLPDPTVVLPSVAAALGVREAPGRPLAALVAASLRERPTLLVLDNFEHLVETAPIVTELLAVAPGSKALVTSRSPLRLRGEHEYPVPPLPLPDVTAETDLAAIAANEAVAFFTAHARAARPDFHLTLETAPAVVAICRQLDGLPLALELAAARIKVLPPAALLARLEQRLPLLTGGARDAPERQRTLRGTIRWSHDLLSPEEQVLFRRLAVFAGGWALEAAEAVVNPEGDRDVLDGLSSLVDKSLVRLHDTGSEPRYGMLETIREFAMDQLTAHPDEERATRQAHAVYFGGRLLQAQFGIHSVDSGRSLTEMVAWAFGGRLLQAQFGIRSVQSGRSLTEMVAWATIDQDNLRIMIGWLLESGEAETAMLAAASLSQYWTLRGGQFAEGRAMLERALRQGNDASPAARVEAFYGIAMLALYQGDLVAARAASSQGLALARQYGEGMSFVRASTMCIEVARTEGRVDEAVALGHEAIAVARSLDNPVTVGWALLYAGRALYSSGDLQAAEAMQNEALATFRRVGERWGESDAIGELAIIARDRGDSARAAAHYAEALRMRHEMGGNVGIATGLVGVAELARRAGRPDAAARLFGAASAHVDRLGYAPLHRSRSMRGLSLDQAREAIGEERFARGWEAGLGLTTDEAVAEAIALAEHLCGGSGGHR